MAFDTNIPNIAKYNLEMSKSLMDKVFFLDKVDADIYIDYGCADGMMISFIEKFFPDVICIGYDISESELSIARQNVKSKLFSDWGELSSYLDDIRGSKKVAVICNSLIHEVYSYGSLNDISVFWERLYDGDFDYICIRDMAVSEYASRRSDQLMVSNIRRQSDRKMLREFEDIWGSIDENKNLIHYLMKYRYTANWSREVKENYLPLSSEAFLRNVPSDYQVKFHEVFTLEYLRDTVKRDFGVIVQEPTHIKLIIERK